MRHNGGPSIIPVQGGVPQQGSQPVQILTPFNDTQLVAFLASQNSTGDPKADVEFALRIVAESIVQMQNGGMDRAIQAARPKQIESV